jgi:hypothetical protein
MDCRPLLLTLLFGARVRAPTVYKFLGLINFLSFLLFVVFNFRNESIGIDS